MDGSVECETLITNPRMVGEGWDCLYRHRCVLVIICQLKPSSTTSEDLLSNVF